MRSVSQQDILAHAHRANIFILVVEDESLLRMDAVHIVEAAGYAAFEAASAAQAIALLERRDGIKAVFSDIHSIGEPNGLKLAHIIRERWPPVGLVLSSGWSAPAAGDLPI